MNVNLEAHSVSVNELNAKQINFHGDVQVENKLWAGDGTLVGENASVEGSGIAIGRSARALNNGVAIGYSLYTGAGAVGIGASSSNAGLRAAAGSVFLGGCGFLALSTSANCKGKGGVAIGNDGTLFLGPYCEGNSAIAIGTLRDMGDSQQTTATGTASIALGGGITRNNRGAYSLGYQSVAVGGATSVGTSGARTYGSESIALGTETVNSGVKSVALGHGSSVSLNHNNAVAIRSSSTAANELSIISLGTTFQTFSSTAPSAGSMALPTAQAFLRVKMNGVEFDLPLLKADSS